MSERLTFTNIEPLEKSVDRAEAHDPELAIQFGRVVMESIGVEAFTLPTMKETINQKPFGTDLVEEYEGVEDNNDTDLSIVAAAGEHSKTWGVTVDF